jgi:redox-sensitive bicupin YhaK (pirin superfamily)
MTLLSATAEIDQIVLPPARDLGGFEVRRALPSAQRQMVGPFIFFDAFGPVTLTAGQGIDSRPHPHIGLSTLSYLIEGEVLHRDSEGHVQALQAGDVNLMTAGRGIVHSERTTERERASDSARLFGVQSWIALPARHEETAPGFQNVPAQSLPRLEGEGIDLRLLAGSLLGRRAPTLTHSDLFNADVALIDGARFRIDAEHIERAVYVLSGQIQVQGQSGLFGKDQLVVFKPGAEIVLKASGPARLMVLGGEPLAERRHVYWNFVSSRRDRIEQAVEDWREQRFAKVPDETEFTPLPEAAARAA